MSMWTVENGGLTSPSGKSWKAASGPYGKGRLEKGIYTIGTMVDVNPPNYRKGAFKDSAGNAWFCPIKSDSTSTRKGLGIHPDGSVPGTEGCIGLTEMDTSSAYSKLKQAKGEKLEVK